jgi:hypothetical protein
MNPRRRSNAERARALAVAAGGALPPLLAAIAGVFLVRAATAHRRPRPVPQQLLFSGGKPVQLTGDGHGTLFHRRYTLVIDRPRLRRKALMERIKADVAAFSPKLLAEFRKIKGHPRLMRVGDEYDIKILGPWNGQVRVAEVSETSFTFVTLEGHPEAGQITFAVTPVVTRPGAVCIEINSWARSRDMVVSLGYKDIPIGKEVQKNAWVTFCERVAEASGGTPVGEVEVVTEEIDAQGEVAPVA